MKSHFQKCILLLMFSISTLLLHGQTEKGRLYVGANLRNFSIGISRNSSQFGIGLDPAMGKFVADNWVVGGRLGLSFGMQRDAGRNFNSTGFAISAARKFGRRIASQGWFQPVFAQWKSQKGIGLPEFGTRERFVNSRTSH